LLEVRYVEGFQPGYLENTGPLLRKGISFVVVKLRVAIFSSAIRRARSKWHAGDVI
jgi:hypothetical protein